MTEDQTKTQITNDKLQTLKSQRHQGDRLATRSVHQRREDFALTQGLPPGQSSHEAQPAFD
ncbi:hypothetical protein [Trichothermofontia sp.]